MTDINVDNTLDDDETVALIELMFFAYRDFVSDPDTVLEELGFGRAHHRVVHFVGRDPGMTVAQLLDILRITKQSLGRVLKDLIDKGYVFQNRPAPAAAASHRGRRGITPEPDGAADVARPPGSRGNLRQWAHIHARYAILSGQPGKPRWRPGVD
jgi:hypothetical protein